MQECAIIKNKNIALGVCGSVAIYKSLELIREYKKNGANVRVVLSKSATKFIKPMLFEAISGNKVLSDKAQSWCDDFLNNHIEISRWADVFVIAPCSANTLNKFANGISDNVLTDSFIASNKHKKTLICMSANTKMLNNNITQKNIKKLKKLGCSFVSSVSKTLICKEYGDGALASVGQIFNSSVKMLKKNSFWHNKSVIINGGGSIEPIDGVRYISNYSSGKMAISLAKAFYYKGANVHLVGSQNICNNIELDIAIYRANSVDEHFKTIQNIINNCDNVVYFVGAGAMSDYTPKIKDNQNTKELKFTKLKKQNMGDDFELKLTKTIDVIKSLKPKTAKQKLIKIGFKCELDEHIAKEQAFKSLQTKGLELVCLNVLKSSDDFGSGKTNISVYAKKQDKEIIKYSGSKLGFGFALAKYIKNKLN